MSELESILNYLETTSMEPHDDYTSEFSYKEQKVLWKYIKQLQQENKKYKEVIDKALEYINENSWYYNDEDSGAMFCLEEEKAETFCNDLLEILKEV